MNGLSLCSWNANGILNKIIEFKLFVEKYDPDILLVQETHLRPTHNINIKNYICYRNDRITNGPATGGTLIFIKNSIPHVNPPTLQHIEITTVTITPPNTNHISITSIYVPPRSDNHLFTCDLETILQINSNCVIFGDFNATHRTWNCSHNSTRENHLKSFADNSNLEIAFPASHTRYGYNSSNTLDFALISNFNFPCTIESIPHLSHLIITLLCSVSKNLTSSIHKSNPRAITTCCSAYKINLKNHFHLSDYANINSELLIEEKLAKFTDAVSSAHDLASKPITNTRHSYTPHHIKQLITMKNRVRKTFQRTLNPIHKTEANRLQSLLKKELRIHNQNTWATKLASLETQDNSLWQMQKHFRKKR
ncbi:probable RNA-directed DNA polymerase from transposon X-element [Trichonephila clavipes]|uniref:Probable RNA-directed DNA polymerase from transposon X-element n=1 Tax=Trichonephila clavipes TaxID=2585209 RepID=A0A8X6SSR2_TRICX|nr:probable RNA-directed DNA polymerase from transposon X-element [Trichonephila clavipes]